MGQGGQGGEEGAGATCTVSWLDGDKKETKKKCKAGGDAVLEDKSTNA